MELRLSVGLRYNGQAVLIMHTYAHGKKWLKTGRDDVRERER